MKTLIKKLLLIVLVFIAYFFVKIIYEPESECKDLDLPVFGPKSISEFNGLVLDRPIYIAYQGCVYDVSENKSKYYGFESEYNYLTGRDSTQELNVAGGGIIKSKYKIIGKYEK